MIRKWLILAVLVATAAVILNLSSCGRSQQLVSIQIQPATETFGSSSTSVAADAGLQVQLRALGSYIHPPVTKDIIDASTRFSAGISTPSNLGIINCCQSVPANPAFVYGAGFCR